MDPALESLKARGQKDGRLVKVQTIPARTASYAPWPNWVAPEVIATANAQGIDELWEHQLACAQSAHEGTHTVLATGTGSGKSWAAWLPILSDLAIDATSATTRISQLGRRPTALYLCPTKALAADQLQTLQKLIHSTQPPLPVQAFTADGDTASELKRLARGSADIIISNPDYIHHVMAPGHAQWTRFLRSLKYLIIDEIHAQRGVAGAHTALVIRRLLRLARHYGANPTVIGLSATLAEPAACLAQILGCENDEVKAITEDASPAAAKELWYWQPALRDPLAQLSDTANSAEENTLEEAAELVAGLHHERRSVSTETAHLLAYLANQQIRTLAFVRSRYGAEQVAQIAQKLLTVEKLSTKTGNFGVKHQIAAYRGGYLPDERRALEKALREGELVGLATTNALELGIDIAGLEVAITAGWPGSIASIWQQAGRSGRAGKAGVAIFVASENPLDDYLIHHPEMLADPPEHSVFDTSNPFVLGPHLCAAAAELPLGPADWKLFDLTVSSEGAQSVQDTATDSQLVPGPIATLAANRLLVKRPGGWFWNATLPRSAHDLADLRGTGGDPIQVVRRDSGEVIGTVDAASAHNLVHPGAIYIHQGQLYTVTQLDDLTATVIDYRGDLRTRPTEQLTVQITSPGPAFAQPESGIVWQHGNTNVITQITDYDVLRQPGMHFVTNRNLDLPPRTLQTKSTWITFTMRDIDRIGIAEGDLPGALHGAEHALIGMLPLLATCDRSDLGGLSTVLHPQTGTATIFVHDAVPGGAGFSYHGFQNAAEWVELTYQQLKKCPCQSGCPRCVQSPKCGNGNEPLNKTGALKLLAALRTP
ncbi:hypothetical protein BK816_00655 [Boudabousia tangfeifanii]|uniref:DEAD/DEAH box helicase n=1 Tax=Boudabousia tangfeifanii TaxID=1912795 RepID=A0A1D9MI81_9ACTO|nr:DEAD/DEAH box helicase [Boudabousia tangfeifanii]AOZ71986.1 hypothetical protein BK816_00655 [Boudabousia tangfeifanii]